MYIVTWVSFSASESLVTAEEVGLYLPLILCIGTVLSVGFGPQVEANSVLLTLGCLRKTPTSRESGKASR
uniref:Uncharacterized protein n=1 Tax=Magallana gigas TaxID=29159 RepID=K1QGV0_MAGGI